MAKKWKLKQQRKLQIHTLENPPFGPQGAAAFPQVLKAELEVVNPPGSDDLVMTTQNEAALVQPKDTP